MTMPQRPLGPASVSVLGYGCMNLSHAYDTPPEEATAARLLNQALDLGCTHLDTAALYGLGANESLIGKHLAHRRHDYLLASKCGMFKNAQGVREIDARPATLKATVEASLQRLNTEVIDLCYLHRWDKKLPIEDSVGALADLVVEGKIRSIGLSEVSAETLRRAHAVHPIAAVQSEYSLWTRNPEIAVLEECRRLGAAFVAFSPLARGFLAGSLWDVAALEARDIRRAMPRFSPANYAGNLMLYRAFADLAHDLGLAPAQLALAWVLSRGEHVLAIPGTTRAQHLVENCAAASLQLDQYTLFRLDQLINQRSVHGERYNAANQAEIDTEEFA